MIRNAVYRGLDAFYSSFWLSVTGEDAIALVKAADIVQRSGSLVFDVKDSAFVRDGVDEGLYGHAVAGISAEVRIRELTEPENFRCEFTNGLTTGQANFLEGLLMHLGMSYRTKTLEKEFLDGIVCCVAWIIKLAQYATR